MHIVEDSGGWASADEADRAQYEFQGRSMNLGIFWNVKNCLELAWGAIGEGVL